MFLCGYENVIATLLHLYAQTCKALGDDSQVLIRDVLDGYLALGHGCHSNETTHLDHIG